MIKLAKLFSRERTLFYFFIWNDSDRRGFSKWLGYKIKNNLFLREGKNNKISVWYEKNELDQMMMKIRKEISNNPELINKFKRSLIRDWEIIFPYLKGKKKINSSEEFIKYYQKIVSWWSVMTIVWYIPDLKRIPLKIKKEALDLRIATEMYSAKFNHVYEYYFKKYFPEYAKYVHVLSPKEIYSLKNRKFTKKEADGFKTRLNGFGLFNNRIYLLNELQSAMRSAKVILEENKVRNIKKIKGVIASKGKRVKGRVRLLLNKSDIERLKKGEILITEMTDPDFLPAMKKALAIITDEGGMTCHAAIVARELKKPCIIGTKIATKVLKDGDLVEVDANKGIVKILK